MRFLVGVLCTIHQAAIRSNPESIINYYAAGVFNNMLYVVLFMLLHCTIIIIYNTITVVTKFSKLLYSNININIKIIKVLW